MSVKIQFATPRAPLARKLSPRSAIEITGAVRRHLMDGSNGMVAWGPVETQPDYSLTPRASNRGHSAFHAEMMQPGTYEFRVECASLVHSRRIAPATTLIARPLSQIQAYRPWELRPGLSSAQSPTAGCSGLLGERPWSHSLADGGTTAAVRGRQPRRAGHRDDQPEQRWKFCLCGSRGA